MGVIDRLWIKVTCTECGSSETSSARDTGSNWSGSHWGNIGKFEQFQVVATGGGKDESKIISAKCKACGGATVLMRNMDTLVQKAFRLTDSYDQHIPTVLTSRCFCPAQTGREW